MYPLMFIIKFVLVFGFGIAGILSVSRGFGLPIPFLQYGALEAWNVLVGAGLMVVSLCVAFFWHLPRRRGASDADAQGEWLASVNTTSPQNRSH